MLVEGYTYYIQAVSGGPIKIGYATNYVNRMSGLQTGSPWPLVFVGIEPGDFEAERHRQFSDLRCSGEWFHNSRKLCNFLRSLTPPKVSVTISPPVEKALTLEVEQEEFNRQSLEDYWGVMLRQLVHVNRALHGENVKDVLLRLERKIDELEDRVLHRSIGVAEVAGILGITEREVRRRAKEGELRAIAGPNKWRFWYNEIVNERERA